MLAADPFVEMESSHSILHQAITQQWPLMAGDLPTKTVILSREDCYLAPESFPGWRAVLAHCRGHWRAPSADRSHPRGPASTKVKAVHHVLSHALPTACAVASPLLSIVATAVLSLAQKALTLNGSIGAP